MRRRYLATPRAMVSSPLRHRELLWELVKRDFLGRYKGSVIGVAWSLFNPLLMLAIYTFVFSVAFKAKWNGAAESNTTFTIVLFSGMIIHSFFAECFNRAPGLIISHPNFVKKVVFPIEILSWMTLFSALIQLFVSFCVLFVFCLVAGVRVHVGASLIPIILLPLILMMLGFSWLFASLGVYLRDLSQVIGMISSVTLFLAPVFYPIEALPEAYQSLLAWNPITLPVIQLRDLMLWGNPIHWGSWASSLAAGFVVCQTGYWWFQKSRQGFADVI